MKEKILTLLKENEGYLSGQELCDFFGVSRTAVWKAVKQLKEAGYEIDSVPNKGYKLLNQPDIVSKSEILDRIQTDYIAREIYCFQEIGSTNTEAKRLLEEGADDGFLVVSDTQKSGKGRRGRAWVSKGGTSIYMTVGLRPDVLPNNASMLTLVMALAVLKGIERAVGITPNIKWPNDIVLNKKKITGILTEMTLEGEYISSVIIGVGINVNNIEFPDDIKNTATSIFMETGKKSLRAQMIADIMKEFETYYSMFCKEQSLEFMIDEYHAHLINKDAAVKVLDPKGEWKGTARGITSSGELLVENLEGELVKVYAGEVSVRGIYGYV